MRKIVNQSKLEKMKTPVIVFLLFLIVLAAFALFEYSGNKTSILVTPSITPTTQPTFTPSTATSCSAQAIDATARIEPAAGNVFITAVLKNTSKATCFLDGGTYADFSYDKAKYKTTTIVTVGPAPRGMIELLPGQALYAAIRYPNGPQCSGGVQQIPTMLTYTLVDGSVLHFNDGETTEKFSLQGCIGTEDITEIIVNPFSTQELD